MKKDIGKINKNDTTDIVIRVDDFGGVKGVTIREFETSDRYTEFTKLGVRILASDFANLKEMINSITDEDLAEERSEVKGENAEQEPLQTKKKKPKEDENGKRQAKGTRREGIRKKIGVIGVGIMGRPMAMNRVKAGYELTVYDLNPEPVKALVTAGATEGKS